MAKTKYYMRVKKSINRLPSILYSLYVYRRGEELTNADIFSIENTLNRYRKKYPHVSFLMVVSNTDSHFCIKRLCIEQGRKGRPTTKIIGKQVPRHVHIAIIGDEKHSPYKFLKDVKKALDKRFNGKKCSYWSKGDNEHAINFINYILRQSYRQRKNGLFNEILEKKNITKITYL